MVERLLCILSNMNAGGAETFLMKLYRTLDRAKYQFDFCLNVEEKCFYEDEIIEMGGRIFRIPPKSESVKKFKKQLSEIVKQNNYKYVLRITANAAGLLDLKIAKKAGAKVCIARSSNSMAEGGVKTHILHKIGQILYLNYVDKKIAPSDLAAIYTFGRKAYKNGQVEIIHNALDYDVYRFNQNDRDEIRAELGIDKNAIVIGHIGRFMQQKNHEKLLKICKCLSEKNPDFRFVLVGDGELEKYIKELIISLDLNDKVILAGVRADVPRLLSSMDIFVMPSLYEGMPNTVIEAQANGLHCIISDTITREANITGLVDYLSLDLPDDEWASVIYEHINDKRIDTKNDFITMGYDIDGVVKKFEHYVFGE